jgi:glycosyltransferase involved in cell wall biosynthesis
MKVCDALTELGHELQVLAPREGQPASWKTLSSQYGLRSEFRIDWLPSAQALKRLDFMWYAQFAARKFKPDLIYTWLPQSATLGSLRGGPVVLEMHADVAGRLGAWWLRQFWRTSGRKRMLVTTRALRSALERAAHRKFPDEAVQIAPNGVDLNRYKDLPDPPEARRRLELKEGLTVGYTGHFYAGRGLDLLMELAQAMPDVNYMWVGGTPDAVDEWRAKLTGTRTSNVTLTGFIDNSRLPLYQAASDILLMPYGYAVSASSGQDIAEVINPMKMFEYMAAGRAIVTADLPVIREVLDETRALFCLPGDIGAWKSGIEILLADGKQRSVLAANARRAVEKYTWLARAQHALDGWNET